MGIIGIDLGTTNLKALAIGDRGVVLGSANRPVTGVADNSAHAEVNAENVWQALAAVMRDLTRRMPAEPVAAIGLSGAMHSLLPVDPTGQPLAPAATWIDHRSVRQAQAFKSLPNRHEVYLRTGCPLQTTYFPARLRWWQENHAEVWKKAARWLGIKDWILYRLTGRFLSDFEIASATGLFDIRELAWSAPAMNLAGIDADRLPGLAAPASVAGPLLPEPAALFGLPAGVPVVLGGSDGGLATLGSSPLLPGNVTVTVGTSGAVRLVVDAPSLDPKERTWCYWLWPGRWIAGGAINNGGLAVQWVGERFYPEGYERLFADAARVPPGANGLICLPYFTGERSPRWDPTARATFYGLGIEHDRAAIARAVLEGVAFCLKDVWQALASSGSLPSVAHLTGMITRSPAWMQILADVLNVTLLPSESADASALGAALTAALAMGMIDEKAFDLSLTQPGQAVDPDPRQVPRYAEIYARFQKLQKLLKTE